MMNSDDGNNGESSSFDPSQKQRHLLSQDPQTETLAASAQNMNGTTHHSGFRGGTTNYQDHGTSSSATNNSTTYADAVMNGIHHDPLAVNNGMMLPRIQELQQPQHNQDEEMQHKSFLVRTQHGGETTTEGNHNDGTIRQNSNGSNRASQMSLSSGGQTPRGGGATDMSLDGSTSVRALTPGAMSYSEHDEVMVQEVLLGGGVDRQTRPNDSSVIVNSSQSETQQLSQERNNHGSESVSARASIHSSVGMGSTDINPRGGATAAHERIQNASGSDDITGTSTPKTSNSASLTVAIPKIPTMERAGGKWSSVCSSSGSGSYSPGHTALMRLPYILGKGTLVMINFSQRNLSGETDGQLIRSAILSNPQLSVLKLGYNNLGDAGADLIADAIRCGGGRSTTHRSSSKDGDDAFASPAELKPGDCSGKSDKDGASVTKAQDYKHHPSLIILDLGFNNISDDGCTSLAKNAVSRNSTLSTLYLSGNAVSENGALALGSVIATGCGLTKLHLTANRIGPKGVRGLMRSIAEFDVIMQMAQQDRENRLALEEKKKKEEEDKRGKKKDSEEEVNSGPNRRSSSRCSDVDLELLGINDYDDGTIAPIEDDLSRLKGLKCMEELYLGGTKMGSTGCLAVSNMLLTNLSLRTLCLSDNGLNDQDLSLFSQSLSRNRELPLETLRLSFNKLSCVGVETLMNAIWGSKSLREIKLDNNQIKDRGAQLAAVVLTSVHLHVLDMGFNRLTIVGIKALMKSLAENKSLLTLTLSGNVLDTNASKAVSYALAYNRTIRKLYVDHCSLSYAAQRHIAAGIVSNSHLALRVMSGFPLGAIAVTLGLPSAMETWSNEQVLKFIRVMWDRYHHEKEATLLETAASSNHGSTDSIVSSGPGQSSASANSSAASPVKSEASSIAGENAEPKSGPSDPATVVAAAKSAFEALGDAGGALLLTEEPQRSISDSSPMVSSDAVMLEKTPSGSIRVPSFDDPSEMKSDQSVQSSNIPLEVSNNHTSTGSLCTANGTISPETPVDPAAKKRTMEWLRLHFRSLNETSQLPYVYADLMQLYRYFYSPVNDNTDGDDNSVHDGMPPPPSVFAPSPGGSAATSSMASQMGDASQPLPKLSGLQRKISYRGLNNVMLSHQNNNVPSSNFTAENSSKRRPVSDLSMLPATKRARSGKPRIDYFPRLKAKIEHHLATSKQNAALVLLRQLKFVETTLFQAGNPYSDQSSVTGSLSSNDPLATDAEVILIDML